MSISKIKAFAGIGHGYWQEKTKKIEAEAVQIHFVLIT